MLTIKGVRGWSIFKEYDGNPEATAAAFDGHGFLRTGDRVTLLEDGWIRFSDRASDVIKVGGEGTPPSEIEGVVRGVEGVRDVAAVAALPTMRPMDRCRSRSSRRRPNPGRDLEGDTGVVAVLRSPSSRCHVAS